jgi:hypothetical protein
MVHGQRYELIAFLGTTLIAYFGPDVSTKFSKSGLFLGSIIPSVLIILPGHLVGIIRGENSPSDVFDQCGIPSINLATLPFFSTIIFCCSPVWKCAGSMRSKPATRRRITRKPWFLRPDHILLHRFCNARNSLVIPVSQLNLASGVMQAIQYFFNAAGHCHPWLPLWRS